MSWDAYDARREAEESARRQIPIDGVDFFLEKKEPRERRESHITQPFERDEEEDLGNDDASLPDGVLDDDLDMTSGFAQSMQDYFDEMEADDYYPYYGPDE